MFLSGCRFQPNYIFFWAFLLQRNASLHHFGSGSMLFVLVERRTLCQELHRQRRAPMKKHGEPIQDRWHKDLKCRRCRRCIVIDSDSGRLFVEYAVPELGRLQRKQLKKVWHRCRCDSKTGPDSAGSALAELEFSDQSQDSIAARASAHQHTQEELLSVQFKHSIGIEMQAQASKVPASNKAQSDGGLSLVQHGLCREVAKAQHPDTLGRCIKPLLLCDFQCWALSRADQCRSAHIPATAAIPSMSRVSATSWVFLSEGITKSTCFAGILGCEDLRQIPERR